MATDTLVSTTSPKLTADLISAIVAKVSTGNFLVAAAAACKVNERTFYRWLARGREETEKAPSKRSKSAHARMCLALVEAVEYGAATAEVTLFDDVEKPEWKLEKRWPDRYGKRITIDVQRVAVSHVLDALRHGLSGDAFDDVIAVLSDGE